MSGFLRFMAFVHVACGIVNAWTHDYSRAAYFVAFAALTQLWAIQHTMDKRSRD